MLVYTGMADAISIYEPQRFMISCLLAGALPVKILVRIHRKCHNHEVQPSRGSETSDPPVTAQSDVSFRLMLNRFTRIQQVKRKDSDLSLHWVTMSNDSFYHMWRI